MPGTEAVYRESIAGQVIDRALERGRLAHALLLHGGSAETLEIFARHLAGRLLELGPDWAAGGSGHPDFVTLRPSGKSRQIRIGGDASDPNSMRAFIRQLAQSPLSASRKVGVVFEADRLNPSSANAFLKTLEEPPLDTTILLLTPRPYSLLPTIRSRCLNFRLPESAGRVEDPALAGWLDDYRAWLRNLPSGGTDRATAARNVMTVFALVARFSKWIDDAAERALAGLKEAGALENLDKDETEALKVSTSVGVRQNFLATIEAATCALAREISLSTNALAASIKELERAAGLLRVNFNENAALEIFLLTALRAWSGR
ncbi:MAG: DNA polymerase III subunit gamma/tau [Opitutaceae bacterium]